MANVTAARTIRAAVEYGYADGSHYGRHSRHFDVPFHPIYFFNFPTGGGGGGDSKAMAILCALALALSSIFTLAISAHSASDAQKFAREKATVARHIRPGNDEQVIYENADLVWKEMTSERRKTAISQFVMGVALAILSAGCVCIALNSPVLAGKCFVYGSGGFIVGFAGYSFTQLHYEFCVRERVQRACDNMKDRYVELQPVRAAELNRQPIGGDLAA